MYPLSLASSFPTTSKPLQPKEASASTPQFTGATHNLRGRHWVSGDTMRAYLGVMPTPYVGKLPKAFVQAVPNNPKQVYQAMDAIVPWLQAYPSMTSGLQFEIGPKHTPVQLKPVGVGGFGSVYKLTINNQTFALKVFDGIIGKGVHGQFSELATGTYLSQKPYKNLARFFFGNPQAGWGVFEFIDQKASVATRRGRDIRTQATLQDDSDDNSINEIRVDYGGLEPISKRDNSNQTLRIPQIWDLPEEDCLEAFQQAMDTGNPEVQAAVANQIGCLPEEKQAPAFLQAMNTKNPQVQAAAVTQIWCLPEEERFPAFLQAMNTKNSQVQAAAASQIEDLPEEDCLEAFQQAMDTGNPQVQAAAASQIEDLPEEDCLEAFQQAMDTGNPEVQAAAASQIEDLPEENQEQADNMLQDALLGRLPDFVHNLRSVKA